MSKMFKMFKTIVLDFKLKKEYNGYFINYRTYEIWKIS